MRNSIFDAFANALQSVFKNTGKPMPVIEQAGVMATKQGRTPPVANSPFFSGAASTATPILPLQKTLYDLGKQGVYKGNFGKNAHSQLGNALPSKLLALVEDSVNALRVKFGVLRPDWKQKAFEMERENLRPDAEKVQLEGPKGPPRMGM